MDFVDLKRQQFEISSQINSAISKVLEHGQYILGPEVRLLEETLAKYVDVKNCITVSSGTDALLISMMALGIKEGDEVITTPFSFISTVEVIKLLGAKPVYVDIDSSSYNLNPNLLEAAITKKTKLIVPVSLFGQCADMDLINLIANKYEIPVVEDGAQSFGATYKERKSCGLSTLGCTSFFPSKPLGCYGDGGAIFTNDDKLAKIIREIRNHGQDKRYHHQRVGLNSRLDTIQAAILLVKFSIFNKEIDLRNHVANFYTNEFSISLPQIVTPFISPFNRSVFAQYTVLTKNRNEIVEKLSKLNIPTAIHYPTPFHRQPAYKDENNNLVVSESLAEQVLSIPMHPYISSEEQAKIINGFK